MGFRFRRSKSILPGVRLNLGKRGVSASVGRRGNTLNVGRRGVRHTLGLPGTGISHSRRVGGRGARVGGCGCTLPVMVLMLAVASYTRVRIAVLARGSFTSLFRMR